MLIITQTALELGFLYALVAMALFLSYRILDIADLTTDGCFVLGAAVSVTVTAAGHPVLAIFAAMLAGACAGFVTAFLQTKLGVPSILAGIVTNTGLYTINLMAMGWKSNQSLLGGKTVFTMLRETGIGGEWYELLLAAFVTLLAGLLLVLFLGTRMGLSIRATGDNPDMVRASSLNPSFTITIGLCLANMLTALSGAIVGQYQKTVDINSGTGHRRHRPRLPHHRRDAARAQKRQKGRHRRDSRLDRLPLHLRHRILHEDRARRVPEAPDGHHCGAGHCRAEHPEVGDVPEAQNGRQK